jgi:hypothetical protein
MEHFIPILPPEIIKQYLPLIRSYLRPSSLSLRRHLESAHSVFLAILARGDLLQDEIPSYLTEIYTSFPTVLSPRQIRLSFSTVIKLSSPSRINEIMTELLRRTEMASPVDIPRVSESPRDEQSTYLFAAIDSLLWIDKDTLEFWLEQIVFTARVLSGRRRDEFIKRLWECLSGEMGGEARMVAVEWWVKGGQNKVMPPRL